MQNYAFYVMQHNFSARKCIRFAHFNQNIAVLSYFYWIFSKISAETIILTSGCQTLRPLAGELPDQGAIPPIHCVTSQLLRLFNNDLLNLSALASDKDAG